MWVSGVNVLQLTGLIQATLFPSTLGPGIVHSAFVNRRASELQLNKAGKNTIVFRKPPCFRCGKRGFHLPLPESLFNTNLLPTQVLETQAPPTVIGGIYVTHTENLVWCLAHSRRSRGCVCFKHPPLGVSYRNADRNRLFFLPFNNETLANFLKKNSTFYMSDYRIKTTASHENLVQPVVSTNTQISLDVCLILNVCILFHDVPTLI